ncbi:MAG: hypothetical protein WBA91_08360 [Paracoccaceae bacterium]
MAILWRPFLAMSAALLLPLAALAHTGERGIVLTLPTGPFILTAAFAVALTALAAAAGARLPGFGARVLWQRQALLPDGLTNWLASALLLAAVLAGFWGSRDPLSNPLPLLVWTVIWVLLTLISAIFGNVWRDLNPWVGPVRLLRRMLGRRGGIGLARLGHWPAVAGLFLFAWVEIVSVTPADPGHLALLVSAYWLGIAALAVLEGEAWLDKAEFLTVFFSLVARIAPFWARYGQERGQDRGQVTVMGGWPGAQILTLPGLSASQIAFVTLALASVSFDGLHQTFLWISANGFQPLEYPGRSALMVTNSVGLLAAWAGMSLLTLGAVWLGMRLAGQGDNRLGSAAAAPLLVSFLPIATGYHLAHYFLSLLVQGQYALATFLDPRRWLSGAYGDGPSIALGFLSQKGAVLVIWLVQYGMILGAHLLAILLAERIARRDDLRLPVAAHLPVATLMVLYTCFGLWLLSAPVIG